MVLRKSFGIALSHCTIHLLPTAVLAGLIYMNYSILYLGPSFTVDSLSDPIILAVIQVAAKIVELLCVASLTSIVLQAWRSELLADGVPLGLLGCAFWFSDISFLWSPDFLAAAPWSFKKARRVWLYALIVVAGVIATVIGPATAILMLPRSQNVPAGGISYYLPGTATDFWPDVVNSAFEIDVCSFANATKYAVCPSGGYESLRTTLSTVNYSNAFAVSGNDFEPQIQATGPDIARSWTSLLVQSPQSLVPPVISSAYASPFVNWCARFQYPHSVAWQPHAATVILLQQYLKAWNVAVASSSNKRYWSQYDWTYQTPASGSAVSPAVKVACTKAQNLSANATEALFPYLYQSGATTLYASDFRSSNISGLELSQSSYIRTQWTPLAIESFGSIATGLVTTGLLIEFPWSNGSRIAIGCTVTAAWYSGIVTSDRSVDYNAWSYDTDSSTDTLDRPITLDESWLRLLTPSSPAGATNSDDWTPNTLESIFAETGFAGSVTDLRTRPQQLLDTSSGKCVYRMTNPSVTDTQLWNDFSCGQQSRLLYPEWVVATIVADGLSRYGSQRVYNVQPDLRDWTLDTPATFNSSRLLAHLETSSSLPVGFVAQWLAIDVVGYAYYACTTTDYLALAVAGVYILLALSQVLWTLWPTHLVSSSAWDTITELLVLCQNSPPPATLEDASAGIDRLGTFGKVVKIGAVKAGDESGEARLRLVVVDEVGSGIERIKVNAKYR